MLNDIVNITAAILLCVGCMLLLSATFALAKRRFYEPFKDKKIIIITLAAFFLAALLFTPTKSSRRDVKQAIAEIQASVSQTQINANSKLYCDVITSSGERKTIASYCVTTGKRFDINEVIIQEYLPIGSVTLFKNGFQDTVYGKLTETRKDGKIEYKLTKSFKTLSAQKRLLKQRLTQDLTYLTKASHEKFNTQINKNLTLYQWEEAYTVTNDGIVSWKIFFDGKNEKNERVSLTYEFLLE